MPLVQLRAHRSISAKDVNAIAKLLPRIVARSLDGDQERSALKPNDVEVWVSEQTLADVNPDNFTLQIMIFANDFPERRENLGTRAKMIADQVRPHLPPGTKFYVWPILGHAAFVTGEVPRVETQLR